MMSFTMLSQHTKDSLKISKPAFELIVKDLKKYKSLQIAYEVQTVDLIDLADTNSKQLKSILELQAKSEFWQAQVDQQQKEILKLQRKKSNGLTWLGAGAVGGLILGVLISN